MLLTVLRMNQISALEQATYVKFCIFTYVGHLFVPLDQFLQFPSLRSKTVILGYKEITQLVALQIEIAKTGRRVQITTPDMPVCKI